MASFSGIKYACLHVIYMNKCFSTKHNKDFKWRGDVPLIFARNASPQWWGIENVCGCLHWKTFFQNRYFSWKLTVYVWNSWKWKTANSLVFINNCINHYNLYYVLQGSKNTTYFFLMALFNEPVVVLSGMWCTTVWDYCTTHVWAFLLGADKSLYFIQGQ